MDPPDGNGSNWDAGSEIQSPWFLLSFAHQLWKLCNEVIERDLQNNKNNRNGTPSNADHRWRARLEVSLPLYLRNKPYAPEVTIRT